MWFAISKRDCIQKLNGFWSPFFFQEKHHLTGSFIIPQPFNNYNYYATCLYLCLYIWRNKTIDWLTVWFIVKLLLDWYALICSSQSPDQFHPVSIIWIYAVLKYFILKGHKTIKSGSEFKNSWQCNFTVPWITGIYYQHISSWKGL